jgi:hypothetical protein
MIVFAFERVLVEIMSFGLRVKLPIQDLLLFGHLAIVVLNYFLRQLL